MPDPHVIVGTVDRIEPVSPQGRRAVHFRDTTVAYVTPDSSDARALETLRDIRQPAYVRVTSPEDREVQAGFP